MHGTSLVARGALVSAPFLVRIDEVVSAWLPVSWSTDHPPSMVPSNAAAVVQ